MGVRLDASQPVRIGDAELVLGAGHALDMRQVVNRQDSQAGFDVLTGDAGIFGDLVVADIRHVGVVTTARREEQIELQGIQLGGFPQGKIVEERHAIAVIERLARQLCPVPDRIKTQQPIIAAPATFALDDAALLKDDQLPFSRTANVRSWQDVADQACLKPGGNVQRHECHSVGLGMLGDR
jgi:hypothetical protein